jgi:hypothetical protein
MYEMMLELREAAIKFQFLLHFVHVAGTIMIHVGSDGLSRAELDLGKLTNPTTIWIIMHLSLVNTSGKAGAQIPNPPPWEMIHPPGGDTAVCVYPYKVYTAECDMSLTATYQCKTPIPSNKLLVTNTLTNN